MWGTDFGHVDAETDYKIMDKIIQKLPDLGYEKQFEIKYSTMAQYLQAVYEQAENEQIAWPVRTEDFWQY